MGPSFDTDMGDLSPSSQYHFTDTRHSNSDDSWLFIDGHGKEFTSLIAHNGSLKMASISNHLNSENSLASSNSNILGTHSANFTVGRLSSTLDGIEPTGIGTLPTSTVGSYNITSSDCSRYRLWTNGPMADDVIDGTRAILIFYLGMPMILTGLFTSALSLGMFWRDRLTPRTTKLMLSTNAFLDFIFLLSAVFYLEVKMIVQLYTTEKSALYTVYLTYQDPVIVIINYCEILRNWITVLIGLERFVITCYPLHSKSWLSLRTTQTAIFLCALIAALLRLPILIRRIGLRRRTDQYWNEISVKAYRVHTLVDSICLAGLPVLILCFCSFRILQVMHTSTRLRAQNSQSGTVASAQLQLFQIRAMNHVRSKVHKVLMVVLVTFTVCGMPFLPLAFFDIYSKTQDIDGDMSICWAVAATGLLNPVCWFCSLLNSTANFFIYIIHWNKYRQIIRAMLRCKDKPTANLLHFGRSVSDKSYHNVASYSRDT